MIYAQILNGKIVNVIVLNDDDLVSTFSEGFDFLIEIEQNPGDPGIGWRYDQDTGFSSPPSTILEDPDEEYT